MAEENIKIKQYAWHVGLKYGFATKKHSKYDTHYNTDNEYYTVFANNWDGSNVLIKLKPTELT